MKKSSQLLKIAIVGARGIANYGGFETVVAELAPRLVKKGYQVYCTCEKSNGMRPTYKGVKLVYFPLPPPSNYTLRKFFEIIYDIYFQFYFSLKERCDIIYTLGVIANIFLAVPRIFGLISIVNIDGLEWKRSKFSVIERKIMRLFFELAMLGTNYVVIDNAALKPHVPSRYHNKIVFLPNGVKEHKIVPWNDSKVNILIKRKELIFKILPNKYWLVVARLEQENNIHTIVEAFSKGKTKYPLIVVGGYTSERYKKKVESIIKEYKSEDRVFLVGPIYNLELLDMLRQNSFAYIHGHSVGGTNPSLLEAMIMKNIIVVHDNEFNREVCGDSALYFRDIDDLKNKIESIERNTERYIELKEKAFRRAKKRYSWNDVVNMYTLSFNGLVWKR